MKFKVQSVYSQGIGKENEDRLYVGEHRFAVIDGATGLDGFNGTIAAATVCEHVQNTSLSLEETLLQANRSINAIMQVEVQQSVEHISASKRSSCGFVLLQLSTNRLQYLHTGDCMLFIQYKNGTIREVTYDHLAKFDQAAIEKYHAFLQAHANDFEQKELLVKQAHQHVKPLLIANRNYVNTQNGYNAYDGTAKSLQFVDAGQLILQDVQHILLITDGLQLPVANEAKVNNWLQTAQFAFIHGLHALHEKIMTIEAQDPYCIDYPRLKQADDKAGILISFQ